MLTNVIKIFFKDPWFFMSFAIIMVTSLIVLVGAFKLKVLNKIENKEVRGTLSFFSSIVASFVFVAIAFWVKDWKFDYYVWTSVLFSCFTIVAYGLYEYTRLRKLIALIGKWVWKRIMHISAKEEKEFKEELNVALEELTAKTKKELKKGVVKHDRELDNV